MNGRPQGSLEWTKQPTMDNDARGAELRAEYIEAVAAAIRDKRSLPQVNRARTAYQKWLSRSGRNAAAELARARQEAVT